MFRNLATTLALSLTGMIALGQGSPVDGYGNLDTAASERVQQRKVDFDRDVLAKMGVDQRFGAQVPGDAVFQDEHGRTIKFGDLYGPRPLIVMPMFFNCQGVCSVETDSLFQAAIQMTDLNIGRDYDIVLLSINPKETPELTYSRWTGIVNLYGRPGA